MSERLEWVEIIEPRTREQMYANLTTGECVWDPPKGAKVKRTDENQWWELFDHNTSRFYYYNADSQKTVWHRPHNCDIIPLAKLQVRARNLGLTTFGLETQKSAEMSPNLEPKSPCSTTSSRSSQHSSSFTQKSSVSCQTQTSPPGSPKPMARRKHHHHHHTTKSSLVGLGHKSTVSCQTQLSTGQSVMKQRRNSTDRPSATDKADKICAYPHIPQPPSLSATGRNSADPELPGDRHSDADQIAAEVQKFLQSGQFETRLSRFPGEIESEGVVIRGSQVDKAEKLRSPSFDGQFVRSFLTGKSGKQAELRRLTPTDKSAADKSGPNWQRNAGGSRSFRLVSTPTQCGIESKLASPADLHTHSVDSTPNFPRRQKSFDQSGSISNNRYELKQANIASIAGSPRIWAAKSGQVETAKSAQSATTTTPVWTAMMKSHDSGIRSCDSTLRDEVSSQRHNDSSGRDSSLESPRIPQNSSINRRGNRVPPGPSQPQQLPMPTDRKQFEPVAQHLTYSQLHQQFILGDLNNCDSLLNDSFPNDPNVDGDESSGDELAGGPLDEEEIFADDESGGGGQSPRPTRRGIPPPRQFERDFGAKLKLKPTRPVESPIYDTPEVTPLPSRSMEGRFQPFPHFHLNLPSVNQPQMQLSQQIKSATLNKRRSDNGGLKLHPSGFGDTKGIREFLPGDISPPNHRPQSMLLSVQNGNDNNCLPPNTATLSRPLKNGGSGGVTVGGGVNVGVSRSASSLVKGGGGGLTPTSISSAASRAESAGDGLMVDYAQENLNRHKKGIFRKRMSIQSMLTWTREPIAKPLIMTKDREVKREAVDIFRRIQIYMGDRKGGSSGGGKSGSHPDQLALEVCILGWAKPPLRDEIFIQLVKQTTENPRWESLRKGWELVAIFLTFFPPSTRFHSYLDSFIQRNSDPVLDAPEVEVSRYAQHCGKKLDRITANGAKRGLRKPTREEVEQSRLQIFNPSMFGNTLTEVMAVQSQKYPLRQLPWIQTQLSELIEQLGGYQTEGLFRVPGDIDEVNALKVRMDQWLIPPVSDPHVPASLLKLWYRELADPLIPQELYEESVQSDGDTVKTLALVEKLPRLNRLVLAYLIRFLQKFIRPEIVSITKMDAANLAMVMAPNCLRCQSEDPRIIFENTRKEMGFIKTLMDSWDTQWIDNCQ